MAQRNGLLISPNCLEVYASVDDEQNEAIEREAGEILGALRAAQIAAGVGYIANDENPVIAEFELNQQVFVPVGNGAPEQWKRKGDLTPEEWGRHLKGEKDAVNQAQERVRRFDALIGKAHRRAGSYGHEAVKPEDFLNSEEMAELSRLQMTFNATFNARLREQRKRWPPT
jgi:hypothetical protein